MNERLRNEVVQLHLGGCSQRGIAKGLGLSRKTVQRVIVEFELARREGIRNPDLPQAKVRRPSLLDPFEGFIEKTLLRYPNITAVRLLEELEARGFTGKYSIVRERLKELRPAPRREPVVRFETKPGEQAQMDYSPYTLDFTSEGRRRVYAFSYVLGYSRRQYLRFVRSQDFTTTIREHVRAFEYLGGAAQLCLYDGMKVVVLGYDGDEPIYNPRFLAFATYYGFRPWACRRFRPETKGKVERQFDYVEKNLLNGRSFAGLEDLNRVTEEWLRTKSDSRRRPGSDRQVIELWEEEKTVLRPLPEKPYDTAQVIYRVADAEGCLLYQGNWYSVPWQLMGELLPVRVTAEALIVYGKDLAECARHELAPSGKGEKRIVSSHRPRGEASPSREILLERYQALSSECGLYLEGLLSNRRYGKSEAVRILGLVELYRREDLVRAIERALRYHSYGFSGIERILAFQASPRPALEMLAEESRRRLEGSFGEDRVEPRPTSEYQHLLEDDQSDTQEDVE